LYSHADIFNFNLLLNLILSELFFKFEKQNTIHKKFKIIPRNPLFIPKQERLFRPQKEFEIYQERDVYLKKTNPNLDILVSANIKINEIFRLINFSVLLVFALNFLFYRRFPLNLKYEFWRDMA